MKRIIPIIMGSDIDLKFAERMGNKLKEFSEEYSVELPFKYRVGSADKTPKHVIEIVSYYDGNFDEVVYGTIAGRANALSGFVSGQTPNPVIACFPYEDKVDIVMDIWSNFRKPSNIYPLLAPGPKQAALAAISIFSIHDPELAEALRDYKDKVAGKIIEADKKIRGKI